MARSYLGARFEVWNGQQSWFWMVADPTRDGGAIGAAASESDAICDALLSIEERQPRNRRGTAASRNSAVNIFARGLRLWETSLRNLELHLCEMGAAQPPL